MDKLPRTDCLLAAVLTPINAALAPDADLLELHCRMLRAKGCDGFALFGTTGEGPEFSVADRTTTLDRLLAGGIDPGRIVVSITALALPDVVTLAHHALDRDVAGLLLMPPCIFRSGVTEEGTFRFFSAAVEAIGRADPRLYLYHFPDICGAPVTAPVIRRLEERYPGRIAGVKDSGGDFDFTAALLRRFSHLSIFTGSEMHLPQALAAGARGTICGLANVMPVLLRTMISWPTEFERREILPHLLAADSVLSRGPFPVSAKAVIAEVSGEPGWRRVVPPLAEFPMIERQRLVADFRCWEAKLPATLQSFPTVRGNADPKVVAIRSA